MSGALGLELPEGTPPWLAAFIHEAQRETDTLRENGAQQAAAARLALLKRLVAAIATHLDAQIDIHEAAREQGVCEETIWRAVRDGRTPTAARTLGAATPSAAAISIALPTPVDGRGDRALGELAALDLGLNEHDGALYVKLVLRSHCVVISFHREESRDENED